MEDKLISKETSILGESIGYPFKTYPNVPTQSLIQRWIREIHKININIKHIPHNQKYGYSLTGSYNEGTHGILKSYDFKSFETYEKALEEGLQECLKIITK